MEPCIGQYTPVRVKEIRPVRLGAEDAEKRINEALSSGFELDIGTPGRGEVTAEHIAVLCRYEPMDDRASRVGPVGVIREH